MEWNSVKDKPIPMDVPVLVKYRNSYDEGFACIDMHWLWKQGGEITFNVVGVWGYDYGSDFELPDITHWLLPTNPDCPHPSPDKSDQQIAP
jgi:hypothetical protein